MCAITTLRSKPVRSLAVFRKVTFEKKGRSTRLVGRFRVRFGNLGAAVRNQRDDTVEDPPLQHALSLSGPRIDCIFTGTLETRVVHLMSVFAVAAVTTRSCPTPPGLSTPSTGPVVQLQITGPTVLYGEAGETELYSATGTSSNGSTIDETLSVTWTSSNPDALKVASPGTMQSVAEGAATLSATLNGLSASLAVQVSPPNWQFVGAPTLATVDTSVYYLAVDPRDERTLYVGTFHGLYVTHDGAGTWNMPVTGEINAVAIDPGAPDTVYAIASGTTLVRSVDRGQSFTTLYSAGDTLYSIRLSLATPGAIFLGFLGAQASAPSGVLRSTDAGSTWNRFPFGVSGPLIPWSIAEDAADGTLYAGTEIGNHPLPYHPPFFRSSDRGQTWVDVTGILPWHVIRTAVNPVTHEVYALTEGANGLFASMDHATTWTTLDQSVRLSLLPDPRTLTHLFGGSEPDATSHGGAFISTRSGAQFIPFGLEGQAVNDLALNGNSTHLYAVCIGSGIYVTNVGQ